MATEPRQLLANRGATDPPTSGLPSDLKERGVRRTAIVAWVTLAVDAVGTLIDHGGDAFTDAAWPTRHHVFDLVGSAGIAVLCAAVIVAARSAWSVERRLWAAVGFLIALAFAIAVTDNADGYWTLDGGAGHSLHGMPAVIAVMIITPVIVPMTARRAVVAATAMAAAGPVSLYLDARILGLPIPDAQPFVQSFPFLVIPVSAVLAHIVHRLGLEVKSARALGSYTLEEKLGEGGMGEVWRAKHRFLARPAAVKLIRGAAGDEVRRERFEREAQATAALKSPHTVEVYDFGVSNDGQVYYVMELLDGFDLEQLVECCGAQPAPRVVGWLSQACHSLREAHDAGIVHRDIKPANLFTCKYGLDGDFLKVLDFGLATLAPAFDSDDARLTGDGKIVGTPAYMPPEIATGSSAADARSDIYALGCVAYFALTGRRLFDAASPIEVILGHVDKTPVPPSELVAEPIPEPLERLVLDCLAKAPGDRPQSAGEMLARLAEMPSWSAETSLQWWTSDRDRLE